MPETVEDVINTLKYNCDWCYCYGYITQYLLTNEPEPKQKERLFEFLFFKIVKATNTKL